MTLKFVLKIVWAILIGVVIGVWRYDLKSNGYLSYDSAKWLLLNYVALGVAYLCA